MTGRRATLAPINGAYHNESVGLNADAAATTSKGTAMDTATTAPTTPAVPEQTAPDGPVLLVHADYRYDGAGLPDVHNVVADGTFIGTIERRVPGTSNPRKGRAAKLRGTWHLRSAGMTVLPDEAARVRHDSAGDAAHALLAVVRAADEAQLLECGLTRLQADILDFERAIWREPAQRIDAIYQRFPFFREGTFYAVRYHRILRQLLVDPAAERYAPEVVARFKRQLASYGAGRARGHMTPETQAALAGTELPH